MPKCLGVGLDCCLEVQVFVCRNTFYQLHMLPPAADTCYIMYKNAYIGFCSDSDMSSSVGGLKPRLKDNDTDAYSGDELDEEDFN